MYKLNKIVGYIHCKFKYTEQLLLVNEMVCDSFRLYPSCTVCILKEIYFYMLCIKQINYAYDIKLCIAVKQCIVTYKTFLASSFNPESGMSELCNASAKFFQI